MFPLMILGAAFIGGLTANLAFSSNDGIKGSGSAASSARTQAQVTPEAGGSQSFLVTPVPSSFLSSGGAASLASQDATRGNALDAVRKIIV